MSGKLIGSMGAVLSLALSGQTEILMMEVIKMKRKIYSKKTVVPVKRDIKDTNISRYIPNGAMNKDKTSAKYFSVFLSKSLTLSSIQKT